MDIEYKQFPTKQELYGYINEMLVRITQETCDSCAALANASALFKMEIPHTNWTGFYILKGGELVLGPFQGKPAVVRIAIGSGVCGTAIAQNKAQIVEDVHKCCNHIACDLASSSEIVVPIYVDGAIWGVIDIDSPAPANFDEVDLAGLQSAAKTIGDFLKNAK